MTTHGSNKLFCSKGLKKDRAAHQALKRRQQARDALELRQLANQYGIDHKEIQ
ncbi:hypothetical protein ACL00X_06745 [Aeromonas diversa]|uniref:hypothetical protein n=1 Tax=Aeromonas diversa TaxID=502790 RepID=UPI0039A26ABE